MDRKRDHELQTHRLVSSGAGASAVSTNTSRAPTEPAAGISADRTGSCPLARLRTARPAGSRGGRSAGRGESARHAECGRCRPVTRLQLCRRRSLFILSERATSKTCDTKR